jgi:hypothetical protein
VWIKLELRTFGPMLPFFLSILWVRRKCGLLAAAVWCFTGAWFWPHFRTIHPLEPLEVAKHRVELRHTEWPGASVD